jgi:hypothetical protein
MEISKLTLSILNDLRVVSFHNGDARVGGSKINANDAKDSLEVICDYIRKLPLSILDELLASKGSLFVQD